MNELNQRRQAVLAIVIQEYIASAQPVGSKTVVESYGLKLSPATVRNEMKALEEQGFLTHPHTSAGRMPTEEGYRYFVERLLPDQPLPIEDQLMIQHQFHQVRQELDQWAQLAAAVLAHTARMAALATHARVQSCRFKHLQLIEVRDGLALLVLVLHQGTVKQQMLNLEYDITQDELAQLSNQLNSQLAGKTCDEIAASRADFSALGQSVTALVRDLMLREDRPGSQEIYQEGLSHMLVQPEFANVGEMQQVMAVLEQPPLLGAILDDVRQHQGVQVLIGGEGRHQMLRDLSLVLAPYGVTRGATGVLGVLGPVRMHYGRTIPLVRYVAGLMSDLVRAWYE